MKRDVQRSSRGNIGLGLLLGLTLHTGMAFDAFGQSMPGTGRTSRPPSATPSDHPKRLKTIGLSLLLPGLGHVEAGHKGRAVPYLIAEAGFWTAFAVFRTQGSLRRDSYIQMAEIYAGVDRAADRDDDYYQLIGSWSSSDAYDQLLSREARALYPDDLEARAAYVAAHRTADDSAWRWESRTAWLGYRDKRQESKNAYRRAGNMLGLAAVNRLAAMLDATLLLNRKGEQGAFQLQVVPGCDPDVTQLQLSWRLP